MDVLSLLFQIDRERVYRSSVLLVHVGFFEKKVVVWKRMTVVNEAKFNHNNTFAQRRDIPLE